MMGLEMKLKVMQVVGMKRVSLAVIPADDTVAFFLAFVAADPA
jgi:hypothetical protein